jgi:hypothetical protein
MDPVDRSGKKRGFRSALWPTDAHNRILKRGSVEATQLEGIDVPEGQGGEGHVCGVSPTDQGFLRRYHYVARSGPRLTFEDELH